MNKKQVGVIDKSPDNVVLPEETGRLFWISRKPDNLDIEKEGEQNE